MALKRMTVGRVFKGVVLLEHTTYSVGLLVMKIGEKYHPYSYDGGSFGDQHASILIVANNAVRYCQGCNRKPSHGFQYNRLDIYKLFVITEIGKSIWADYTR